MPQGGVHPINLGSHRGAAVRKAIRSARAKLILLPKYSPDLNPIEQVFAKLKHLLRKAAVCVLDREGVVLYESTTASTAEAIADELPKRQVVVASYSRRGEWRRSCFTG
jgi:transposase